MREVFVVGVGQTLVRRHANETVRTLGASAIRDAIAGLGDRAPTALFVGNMMAGALCNQRQLGAILADASGLAGIEATVVESACASGAAAIRCATMAIASGMHDVVVACGVERMTHADKNDVTAGLATASDWSKEGSRGETFLSLNAGLTRLYLERHRLDADALAPFSLTAHENACSNEHALLRKPVTRDEYDDARVIEPPLRLYDISPICDGAAAIVLASREAALSLFPNEPRIRIASSSVATDAVALVDRTDPLALEAASASAARALSIAGVGPSEIDFFELHDAYSVMAALSLEAAGFASPGRGYVLGLEGRIGRGGDVPIATMGGLKARGHPVGATGVYQLVEATMQLRGTAGDNQIRAPRFAMTQSFGGTAATVVTHVIERAA